MIKRHYFFHAKWNWQDGRQSHSYRTGIITSKSLFPKNTVKLYDEISEQLEKDFKSWSDKPMGKLEITAFNRV